MATEKLGLADHEPTPNETLKRGVDLVCFSGDKLLGGPQAGIIAGKARFVAALKREPLFRALRCDKLVFAALAATVEAHLRTDQEQIPILKLLQIPIGELRERGEKLIERLRDLPLRARLVASKAQMGGGALPRSVIPSVALELVSGNHSPNELAALFRRATPARYRLSRAGPIPGRSPNRLSRAGRDGCRRFAHLRNESDVTPKNLILATAGHVDHGKTALIKALTGIDTDRLPEEKARGITIDLGFAHLELSAPLPTRNPQPSTFFIGVIDVPGHGDFIRNMIAGLGAIDLALLVVAADDGWMPQTEEHFQILHYLGIRHGVVAITKCDLGDPAQIAADVRKQLRGTSLSEMPIVQTSVRTAIGLEELKETLPRVSAGIPPSRDYGKPRLFVDRVFTVRWHRDGRDRHLDRRPALAREKQFRCSRRIFVPAFAPFKVTINRSKSRFPGRARL